MGNAPTRLLCDTPSPKKSGLVLTIRHSSLSIWIFFFFPPQLERCKHLWYRKAAQSGPVSVLISPISLPRLPQFERKTSSSLSSSSGLMCKAAPASGSRREMCASLNSLGAAPLHRRRLHRGPSPAEATNAAAAESAASKRENESLLGKLASKALYGGTSTHICFQLFHFDEHKS